MEHKVIDAVALGLWDFEPSRSRTWIVEDSRDSRPENNHTQSLKTVVSQNCVQTMQN